MCGRFALSAMAAEIAEEFTTSGEPNRMLPVDWNIKPTQDIYIIKGKERVLDVVSWGLIAPWSKDGETALRSQSQAINARSETVFEKPTFRNAFHTKRCLIPASGYYEWATELGALKSKQPVYISRKDSHLLAFAGIFDLWRSPEGVERRSAAIMTCDAVGKLADVHNRMPVFLPRNLWDRWLDPNLTETNTLVELVSLREDDSALQFWPVRPLVNSIKNNGAELIEPLEVGEPETLF
ncbi:MAG TPA: SOS response-associated peptidase [Candidatus Nanopelagicaceae bacterium]|jgi:putative SOS response-associated peptidase YedK